MYPGMTNKLTGKRYIPVVTNSKTKNLQIQRSKNKNSVLNKSTICLTLFVPRVPFSVLGLFTLCTIFGRILGFEPQLGVLPISYTHPLKNKLKTLELAKKEEEKIK